MNLRTQIVYILAHDEESRNDDTRLAWTLWKSFYPSNVVNDTVSFRSMMEVLPKMDSINRDRRTVQNTLGLFPPTKMSVATSRKMKRAQFEENHKNNFNYTQAKVILKVYEGVKNKKATEIKAVLDRIIKQLK